jgi:predicted nucleotidyltransferase component of viral defense system
MDKSLVEKTHKVIASISKMETIKPYIMVGGTALSLQMEHRLSEDLDFMRWQERKNEKMHIDVSHIQQELKQIHQIEAVTIFEFNHVEFYIDNGVKLSFYAPEKRPPQFKTIPYLNNILLADIDTIAALKVELMLRRAAFRDYYDLYCIFRQKTTEEIKSIIDNALKYSEHTLKSKNLIGILLNSDRFKNDSFFTQLHPKYAVNSNEIAQFMTTTLCNIKF